MPRLTHAALAGVLTLAAAPALAAPGFATSDVNLRAGPGTQYPQVVVVPRAAEVEIFGCLQGYGWCDVGFGGVRGWVASSFLQVAYGGQRYVGPRYVPQVGVPVVTYRSGDYWDSHYRDRPWYGERDRWASAPPPPPPGYRPPPPGYAAVPPPPPGYRDERFARERGDREDRWREERWREERRAERRAEREAEGRDRRLPPY